jgi:hypothetical protein
MLWRDIKGRTREIHKQLQDLDWLCSLHLEKRWIGGNIDLDLLFLFPKKYARIMGGMEEGGQACKVNNGGERSPIRSWLKEEEGVFIPPPLQKSNRCSPRGGISGSSRGGISPPPRIFRAKIRPHYLERTTRNSRVIHTKMVITFASGLRFRWSWARWNHHNELYNFIHRKKS